jgi:hypothetical protein
MSRAEVKESRTVLRRIDAHLRQSHLNLGAQAETVGFVDVIHHRTSPLPALNYVTPRQNTALVPAKDIQQGLAHLRTKGLSVRVRFAEGLFPPFFTSSLRELGLSVESETLIMMYKAEPDKPRKMPRIPSDVAISYVNDHQSMGIWWYVWRNAYYDVFTSTAEPLFIGRDMQSVFEGQQLNLILYRHRFPVAVIRITRHEGTAHILAHALMKEVRTPEWDKLIRTVALDAALHSGCDLIFATGTDEDERRLYREIGFIDSGTILSYAEIGEKSGKVEEAAEPSILVI